jgi:hypothetical protein
MIHPIPPGLTCVPAAVAALTGAPLDCVVLPALNRHSRSALLHAAPGGLHMHAAEAALREMGFRVLRLHDPGRHKVSWWARQELSHPILIATQTHAMVIDHAMVYDTFTPVGCPGDRHPYAKDIVTYVTQVRRTDP